MLLVVPLSPAQGGVRIWVMVRRLMTDASSVADCSCRLGHVGCGNVASTGRSGQGEGWALSFFSCQAFCGLGCGHMDQSRQPHVSSSV